jgi:hypothetical protein
MKKKGTENTSSRERRRIRRIKKAEKPKDRRKRRKPQLKNDVPAEPHQHPMSGKMQTQYRHVKSEEREKGAQVGKMPNQKVGFESSVVEEHRQT